MNCPKCAATLEATTIEGTEVDHCRSCRGVWCDENELAAIMRCPPAELRSIRGGRQRDDMNRLPAQCPRDGTPLARIKSARHAEIVLDVCPQCHGYWLDGGELDRLMK